MAASMPAGAGAPGEAALPPGEGRVILERACVGCHDLNGLWAYKGYYDERRWHSMLVTMIDHGAALDSAELAVLTVYLAENFGPDSD